MATVELTFKQILEAARQLSSAQQKNLTESLAAKPSPDEVRKVAHRLRPAFRLSPKKRRRMSNLAAKRSAGTLTKQEQAELNDLVEEITENNLRFAEGVIDAVNSRSTKNGPGNGRAKR
jgi:hypothetical protein